MQMTAKASFIYAGRQIKPGDVFEVADAQHARMISLAGRATRTPEQQPAAPQSRKGRYRRRDMRADQDN